MTGKIFMAGERSCHLVPRAGDVVPEVQGPDVRRTSGTCVVSRPTRRARRLKLCPKCGASLHRCEHCLVALDARPSLRARCGGAKVRPAPAGDAAAARHHPARAARWHGRFGCSGTRAPAARPPPPPPPKPINPNRAGTTSRAAGSTRWRSAIPARPPRARAEWLSLRRPETASPGCRNELLPHALGAGLLGRRAADAMGPARLDAVSVPPGQPGGSPIGPAAGSAARPAASPWFEIGKVDNGKHSHVSVGQWVLVRVPRQSHHRLSVAGHGAPAGRSLQLMAEPNTSPCRLEPGVVGHQQADLLQVPPAQPGLHHDQSHLACGRAEKNQPSERDLSVHGRGVDAETGPAPCLNSLEVETMRRGIAG